MFKNRTIMGNPIIKLDSGKLQPFSLCNGAISYVSSDAEKAAVRGQVDSMSSLCEQVHGWSVSE